MTKFRDTANFRGYMFNKNIAVEVLVRLTIDQMEGLAICFDDYIMSADQYLKFQF